MVGSIAKVRRQAVGLFRGAVQALRGAVPLLWEARPRADRGGQWLQACRGGGAAPTGCSKAEGVVL